MTKIAIIQTGGKQYKVAEGDVIKVEKLVEAEGDIVKFPVLFVGDDKEVVVGRPKVEDVVVEGEVVKQGRSKKVIGIKHKPKKRQLKKFGHKQFVTEVKITRISGGVDKE